MTEELDIRVFIDSRIESMLTRPEIWGPNIAVESCLLLLLELRDKLDGVERSRSKDLGQFISDELPNATPEPLAVQLDKLGRSHEFAGMMRRFLGSGAIILRCAVFFLELF